MPTDEKILGFTNRWYREGIVNSIPYEIDKEMTVRILSVPYFIGCKLEALFNRGMGDMRLSKDLEDIVFLLNYGVKVNADNTPLKEYIARQFQTLLNKQELREAIFCVLPAGENDTMFVDKLIEDFKTLSKIQ